MIPTVHRSVRIPRLMRVVQGMPAVVSTLGELVAADERLLLIHSGGRSATGYGSTVLTGAAAAGYAVVECVVHGNTEASVGEAAAAIEASSPDFVLAVGGGRVVDVAKLAGARLDTPVVTIPTQIASDAVCSPVAVIRDADGRQHSLGAHMPAAIIVDSQVVDSAPLDTWLAGLGDLVSNLSAVRDWRFARDTYGEPFDDFACLTSETAAWSVIEDGADIRETEYRQKVIRGLILSGLAMEMAGSSRPASGSEHLISHALDQVLDRPRAHGLQVAIGTIAAGLLRHEDIAALVAFFRGVGLPVSPGDLGIELDDFLTAIRIAPSTRPSRRTGLDSIVESDLLELRRMYERGEVV